MKLILTAEVDHLGSAGDTVEVKDGYGRNFLLPRGLAIVGHPWRAEAGRRDPSRPRDQDRARPRHANELKTAIEALGAVSLPVQTAGDSGKLFGSVTAADVVAAIKKAGGPNLDKRTVQLPKAHIKAHRQPPGRGASAPRRRRDVSLDVVAE